MGPALVSLALALSVPCGMEALAQEPGHFVPNATARGDIEHPRVLLDTTLEIAVDADTETPRNAGYDSAGGGRLGDDTFVYRGVEYTITRLEAEVAGEEEVTFVAADGDGNALDDAAEVGIEVATPSGRTALLDWRSLKYVDLFDEWAAAGSGTVVPLRILELTRPDVWSAHLEWWEGTSVTEEPVGHGAGGALSADRFSFAGVEYTVDRLTMATETGARVLRLSTTPDLPASAHLRLALEAIEPITYYPVGRASERLGRARGGADHAWPGPGPETPLELDYTFYDGRVYLTRASGDTSSVQAVWEAELTVGGTQRPDATAGYDSVSGNSALAPDSATLEGVTYRVDVLVVATTTESADTVRLRTTPPLPLGRGLWLELGGLGHTTQVALDALVRAGDDYVWVGPGLAELEWHETPGSQYPVRLLAPTAPVVVGVGLERLPEGGNEDVAVSAGLAGGARPASDVAVTLAVDGGTADPADYTADTPPALTIDAGSASETDSVRVTANADTMREPPERVEIRAEADGRLSGAPGELAIVDADHPDLELAYWDADVSRSLPFWVGDWWFAGHYASSSAPDSALTTPTFRCCAGRQAEDATRAVRAIGRAESGTDGRGVLVFDADGLIRDGALTEAFRGAALWLRDPIGGHRVRPLEEAAVIDFGGAPALAWPWDEVGHADPGATDVNVRLRGLDHAVLESVEVVSGPRTWVDIAVYRSGHPVEFALRFDEPVAAPTGEPTLAFTIGTTERTATYAYQPDPRTLVFVYTVVSADDGVMDIGPIGEAMDVGGDRAILSVRGLPVALGDLDPAPFGADHTVEGDRFGDGASVVSVLDATADEGAGDIRFTVAASRTSTTAYTVDWTATDGTATTPEDYTTASGTVTMAIDERFATIAVPVVDDTVPEGPETFGVTISSAAEIGRGEATGTIYDDDDTMTTVGVTGPAGGGAYWFERELDGASWTLTANPAPPVALAVNVAVEATGGFELPPSAAALNRVPVPAGATSARIELDVDDETDEPHGAITVRVLPGAGYAVADAASASVTVRDDDFAPAALTFAVEPAAATVVEGTTLDLEQVVRTVADGTFTAPGDLGRALPEMRLGMPRLEWGATTHLDTSDADLAAAPVATDLRESDFEVEATAGGAGLVARRPLTVAVTADGVAEGDERAVVTLARVDGSGVLLRAAEHPGADGFDDVALSGDAFYRAALTVRDGGLALVPETRSLAEGQRMAVRATLSPPRATAFEVQVSSGAAGRLRIVGSATLAFAPGAGGSSNAVTVEALAGGGAGGAVVLTGTPDAPDVSAASVAVRVVGDPNGPILWETELTLGEYADGDEGEHYGYADTATETDLTATTAGSLADATFRFQGVEYTVRRLTLGTSTQNTAGTDRTAISDGSHADPIGEFVAVAANGVELPVGKQTLVHEAGTPVNGVTSVKLGLEVEGVGGAARMRPLQLGAGNLGALAVTARWDEVGVGNAVTVRLVEFAPMAWWQAQLEQADEATPADRNGYWVEGGSVNGHLVPDTFELADAAGEPVLHVVKRLDVVATTATRTLRFATEPPVPPGVATLAVTSQDFMSYDPSLFYDPPDASTPTPQDLYYVLPLTAAAQSEELADVYVFELPAASADPDIALWDLGADIQRALLVPMAGSAVSVPPPAIEEIWRSEVTVGGLDEGCGLASSFVGASFDGATPVGDLSDPAVPLRVGTKEPIVWELGFRRMPGGRTDLCMEIGFQDIVHATRFEDLVEFGLEVQGDYGARTHWMTHYHGIGPELAQEPWFNVDAGHGWDPGEVHTVRVVRPRGGATRLAVRGTAVVLPDRAHARLALWVGWATALPRGLQTPVTLTANGETREVTLRALESGVTVEMDVPVGGPYPRDVVVVKAGTGSGSLSNRVLSFDVSTRVPLTWPEPDADHVEYWSAHLDVEVGGPLEGAEVVGKFAGYLEGGDGVGALDPPRFACCGAPADSAAGRSVAVLGNSHYEAIPKDDREDLLEVVLDRPGAAGLPDDLRHATLHLRQITHFLPRGSGSFFYPLLTADLPLAEAEPSNARLVFPLQEFTEEYVGRYEVRITGPDFPVLTAVEPVAEAGEYGAGDVIGVRLRFDEPVAVDGAPTLKVAIDANEVAAAYAYGSGTDALVFEYVVVAADLDTFGIDVPAFPGALDLTDATIVSVARGLEAVYADYDPPRFEDHLVDGSESGADEPAVVLEGATVREDAGRAPLRVALARAPRQPQRFAYRTRDDDARAGEDYKAVRGEVTVPPGRRSALFEVPVLDDAEPEEDERFEVHLQRDGTTVAETTVTVRDDDTPVVTLTGPALARETGHVFEHEEALWTVTRPAAASAEELTVNLIVDHTGGPFVGVGGTERTVVLPAGATEATFAPLENDEVDELHGAVTVRLRDGSGYALGAADAIEATAEVRDDDGTLMTFRFGEEAVTVAEGNAVAVPVVAETVADGTFTALADLGRVFSMNRIRMEVTTTTGSAMVGNDYLILDEFVNFLLRRFAETTDGSKGFAQVRPVSWRAYTDTDDEGDEDFTVRIGDENGALPPRTAAAEPSTMTVTITEGAGITLAVSPAQLDEGTAPGSGGEATVTATLSGAQIAPLSVAVSGGDGEGTRWEFADANRTLTFPSNTTSSTGTVTIRALPNDVDDGDLEFTLFGRPDSAAVGADDVTVTVVDDDLPLVSVTAPALALETGHVFEVEAAKLKVDGGVPGGHWTVRREGLLDYRLDVVVSATETSGGEANFVPYSTGDTLTFDIDQATTTYTPVVVDDADLIYAGGATIRVTVTVEPGDGTAYAVDPEADSAAADVRDDDGTILLVSLDPEELTVPEGADAVFEVRATNADGTLTAPGDLGRVFDGLAAVPVRWRDTEDTATSPEDYIGVEVAPTLLLAEFEELEDGARWTEELRIETNADADDEGNGTFKVDVAVPEEVDERIVLDLDRKESTVTLVEGATLTLTLSSPTLAEGDSDAEEGETTVSASIDQAQGAPFQVAVTAEPEEGARWEFVGANRTLSFAANETESTGTVTLRARHNDEDDGDLAVLVTGTPDSDDVLPGTVTLTVLDDDLPTVSIAGPTLAAGGGHLFEGEAAGAGGSWTLMRSGTTQESLTVALAVSESGAGDHVVDGAAAATFQTGSATVAFNPVVADAVNEGHATVAVMLTGGGTTYDIDPTAASASAAVRDDDGPILEVTLDPVALTVREGADAVLEARATNADGTLTESGDLGRVFDGRTSVRVTVDTIDGTAQAPGDYTALRFFELLLATFEALPGGGRWTGEVRVETEDDGAGDAPEDFELHLLLDSSLEFDDRVVLGGNRSTVTLVEGPAVTLALSDDDLAEGDETTLSATVDPVHDAPFTVTVTADPASRVEFLDGTTMTFVANASSASNVLRLRAVDNDVDDGDAEVTLEAMLDVDAVTASGAPTLTVRDDDLPTVSVAAPTGAADGFLYESEAAQPGDAYRWTLTRDGLLDGPLDVQVTVTETDLGAAAADHATDGTATVTFAMDAATATYTPLSSDGTDEGQSRVTVAVTGAGATYEADPTASSASLEVRDDDGVVLTLGAAPAELTAGEGSSARVGVAATTVLDGTFTATGHLERLFGTGVSPISVTASTGGGTATAGTDYTALPSDAQASVSFAAFRPTGSGGQRGLELPEPAALPPVPVAEDEVDDADETFEVRLALAETHAQISLAPTKSTVTIVEGPPDGTLRLCDADGNCVSQAGVACAASDRLCAGGTTGAKPAAGRVEMAWELAFGTVCDDYWSNEDGNVACRQMGHAAGTRVVGGSFFGGAADGVATVLDDVRCRGDEASLLECPRRREPGTHNCNPRDRHVEDAGVMCLASESANPGATVDPPTLTLAPGAAGRYWVSLTKRPPADLWIDAQAPSELSLRPAEGGGGQRLRFPQGYRADGETLRAGWSYALAMEVTAGTATGTYEITHESSAWSYGQEPGHGQDADGTFAVPSVTVTVSASASPPGPHPVSASVSGRAAAVRFDAPLDGTFGASAGDFEARVAGRRVAVTAAWPAGPDLLLELAAPAAPGEEVLVRYLASASAPLSGARGGPVAAFAVAAAVAAGEPAEVAAAPAVASPDAVAKLEGAPGLASAVAEAWAGLPGSAATASAARRGIADLSDVGDLAGVRRLDLSGNEIADAGPLAVLAELERLDLSGNAVTDLWPLSGLTELRVLDLSGNRVSDVTALSGLPRLRVLELSGNAVTDVGPLLHLSGLRYLGLSGNRVADATALAELYLLERLNLGGNRVVDASPLGDLSRLVWLDLSGNRLATLDGLGRLTRLRWVWLGDNPLPADAAASVPWPEGARVDVTRPAPPAE